MLPSLRPNPSPKPAPTQTLGLREGRVGPSPEPGLIRNLPAEKEVVARWSPATNLRWTLSMKDEAKLSGVHKKNYQQSHFLVGTLPINTDHWRARHWDQHYIVALQTKTSVAVTNIMTRLHPKHNLQMGNVTTLFSQFQTLSGYSHLLVTCMYINHMVHWSIRIIINTNTYK